MEQMKLAVLAPYGKTNVGIVQSRFGRDHANHVAVSNALQPRCRKTRVTLGQHNALGRRFVLHETNGVGALRTILQKRIGVGVVAHVTHNKTMFFQQRLGKTDRRHETAFHFVGSPPREIVKTRKHGAMTVTIAQVAEMLAIVRKRHTAAAARHHQGTDGLNESGAIQLTEIHHQSFLTGLLKCGTHIGNTQKLTCDEKHVRRFIARLTKFQEFDDTE